MKKTKSLKRILAGALAALMSISTVPLAFAAEAELFPAEGITVTAPEELVVSEGVLTGNPQLTVYNGSNHQMTDVAVSVSGGVSVTLPTAINAGESKSAVITGSPKGSQQIYTVTYTLDNGDRTYTSYGFSYQRAATTAPVVTTTADDHVGILFVPTITSGVLEQTGTGSDESDGHNEKAWTDANLYIDRSQGTTWQDLGMVFTLTEQKGNNPNRDGYRFSSPDGNWNGASLSLSGDPIFTADSGWRTDNGWNEDGYFGSHGVVTHNIQGKVPNVGTTTKLSVDFVVRWEGFMGWEVWKFFHTLNLTITTVDKSALRAAVDEVSKKNYQSADYTLDSYDALYQALVNANAVLGNFKSNQTQIDAAKNQLESAEKALKYAEADYTALDAAVERADQILNDEGSAGIYTQESLEALKAARDAAVALKNSALDFTHQAQVDAAADALEQALDSMMEFANYSEVELALDLFGKLNSAYYDTEAFEKVSKLADEARDSLSNKLPANQQEAVDQMADDLLDAIEALEILDADTAKLMAWITDAMELLSSPEADTYTGASLNALTVAIINGKKVLDANLKIDQQATVDDAAQAIATAYQNLEKLPADKGRLGEKLAEAKTYTSRSDYDDYKEEARTALEIAIESAQAVYDNADLNIDDQAAIDAAVATLMEAIRNIKDNWKPADYAKLNAAIKARKDEVAKAKDAVTAEGAKLYTDASISRVEAVIELAESLRRDLTIKEQSTVDDMIVTLNSVLLEKNPADYTALNRLIEEKQDLLNNDAGDEYTEESKSALQAAINEARKVVAKQYKIDEQDKVDAAVKALEDVDLVLKDADFGVLEAAINAAEKFLDDPDTDKLYKPEAIEAVQDALEKAEDVLGSDLTILDQEKVEQAAEVLSGAVEAAKQAYKLANVDALKKAISAAKEKLNMEDIEDYTDASVNALKEAVAKAQALIAENPNITRQDEVDAMADALNGMALVLKSANKSALEAAITAAEDLLADSDQYTDEFIKELEELLTKAGEMLGKIESGDLTIKDQAEVDAVVAELTGKTGQPGYKEADLKALNAAIEAAQAKINAPGYQNYTDDSRAALEAALDEAIALRNTKPNVTQQAAVNEAAEKLNGIQLVLKGANYDALNAAIAEIEALLKDADLSDRFTNTSIEVLDAALKEAQAVLEAGYDASQQEIVDDAVDALEAARDGLVPYNKIEQGDIRIVGGDERVDDMIYHKTPWYQTYKSQTATLRLEGLEEGWKVVKWEAANWSVDEPEATFAVNDDGTVSVSPNGKGIGARSFWIKVTVEDANGNKATDIVKVRFYNWNWQK